jgi:hypothetical protein
MTYVIIHGRGLAGLGATLDDNAQREVLYAHTSVAIHAMAKKVSDILNANFSTATMAGNALAVAVPAVGLVLLPAFKNAVEARAALVVMRDNLIKLGGATGRSISALEVTGEVARDKSISYSTAKARIEEYLRSTAKNLDDQMKMANSAASVFGNTLTAFEDATKQVANKVVPKDEDVPMWAWGAGGLAALWLVSNIVGKASR